MPFPYIEIKDFRIIILWFLFVLALCFATYQLTESPSFWYDEGWYFQSAANLTTSGIYGVQFSPGNIEHVSMLQTVSYPLIYPLALWMKIFGVSVASGRSLMVIYIMALIGATYWLSRRLFGSITALGTLALLTTFAPLYGNGKSILGEVPGLLYFVLFLLSFSFVIAGNKKKTWWLVASGIFLGLTITTKPFFFILAPAIIVGAIIAWRRGVVSLKEIMITFGAFLIPVIVWYFVQFQSGESLQTILRYYANPYSFDSPTYNISFISKITKSVRDLFTNASTIYTMIIIAIWTVSVGLRRKLKESLSTEEIISFVFTITIFLAYLRVGGIFRYFFPAQIIALVFLPRSLQVVFDFFTKNAQTSSCKKKVGRLMPYIVIIVLSVFGIYQLMFNSWVAEAYGSHKTAFWQEYLAKIPASTAVFFYDTPEVVPFIEHRNYYQLLLSDRQNPLGKNGLQVIIFGFVDMIIVERSKYEPAKEGLFKAYTLEEKLFKYAVLRKK